MYRRFSILVIYYENNAVKAFETTTSFAFLGLSFDLYWNRTVFETVFMLTIQYYANYLFQLRYFCVNNALFQS